MIWVGTSGYNYPEWKGSFYPSDLAAAKMLPYYAARFPTVEINYTFYRMPNEKLAAGWAAQTPEPYKLTLKAPRRITHDSRLKNAGDLVSGFCRVAASLGPKLGALLFQLPPNMKKDLAVFDAFLAELPPRVCAAFEFRHLSWFDDDTYRLLEKHGVALCINDNDEFECPVKITAKHTYIRLRRDDYPSEQRAIWKERIASLSREGIDVLAFIKHKDNPDAPLIALDFARGIVPDTDLEKAAQTTTV